MRALLLLLATLVPSIASAQATEICGNATDDNANGLADEGCFSPSDVCESPLSCSDTGMVSPKKGALRYRLPPDVAPKVPYGPGIGFRRFYTSMYAPAGGAPVWHKPMGERWQHTYMTWLTKTGTSPNGVIVLHTNRGQDVRAAQVTGVVTGWDEYKPQAGVHVHYLRQRQAAPNEFHLRMLSGETLV